MSSPRKRKRTQPPSNSPSSSVINPLSHTPHTLKQFTLAGLSHDSPLLSELYPGFPHRPPRPARRRRFTSHGSDPSNLTDKSGDEGGDELPDFTTDDDGPIGARTTAGEETDFSSTSTGRRKKKNTKKEREKDRKTLAYNAKVGVLINTVKRFLAEGDIPLAKRAFGILVRAKVNGKKVDLRHDRLWELGAELILREGEPPPSNPDKPNPSPENDGNGKEEFKGAFQLELERQQAAASETEEEKADRESQEKDAVLDRQQRNLANLKAYYQHLIQNHPFSKQHPNSTGRPLLEFNVALFSSEMEGIHSLHLRGLERIAERDSRHEFDDVFEDDDMMDIIEEEGEASNFDNDGFGRDIDKNPEEPLPPPNKKEVRIQEAKDELRREMLGKMREVAERMDALLETVPYSRDGEFIRLRAMVGLYIADLSVPCDEAERKRGLRARDKERQKARKLLEGVRDTGKGVLKQEDEELLRQLGSDDEDEDEDEESEGEETVLPMFSSATA
ncbi:hypothetical protein QBC40DRAFT_312173 [Triangularia verruculosa]|uniref:Uncharacterized protein n=1 Tax=Triangularia verruculosa TaxID=2587418 RepID=A0AAN6XNV9_9PEZI|nr:hypothetical protein QBC40DRAFT_312173 [Triangularia verruculosa]